MAMISRAINTVKATGFNTGDVINGVIAVSDYKTAREQGDSKAKSVVKAAASFAWGEFFYGGLSSAVSGVIGGVPGMIATAGLTMLPAVPSIVGALAENGTKQATQKWANRGSIGSGYFNMSEYGYTMRQRSLNAIRQNGLNTRSVLGNEARNFIGNRYI